MSLDMLRVIPIDPHYIPTRDVESRLRELVENMLPDAGEIEIDFYNKMRFIDQGENFERVICPECRSKLELHDEKISDWWYTAVDVIDESDLPTHHIAMPCCNNEIAFIRLIFEWPAGFASFEIAIHDPNIARNLNEVELQRLGKVVGSPLTQVRAHY